MDISFGDWLLQQLQIKGWSQAQLARAADLTPQAISNYINHKVTYPDEYAMANIAAALELPVETVYKAAGIPTTYLPPGEQNQLELDLIFKNATPDQRDDILRYARFIASENRRRPLTTKPSPSETG